MANHYRIELEHRQKQFVTVEAEDEHDATSRVLIGFGDADDLIPEETKIIAIWLAEEE